MKSSAGRKNKSLIPIFSLYGEESGSGDHDFLHIEDIQSRSARHGWDIAPHSHNSLFQVLFVISGFVDVQLDGSYYDLTGPGVVTIPQNVIHGFKVRPGTEGFVLTISEELLSNQRSGVNSEILSEFILVSSIIDLGQIPEQSERIELVVKQIFLEFNWRLANRNLMLQNLFGVFFLFIRRCLPLGNPINLATSPWAKIYERFRGLVEENYRIHRNVIWYAENLGVSTGRLNSICIRLSGRSASKIINERIVLEARRLLTYSVLPVSMISFDLGFKDHAYFCRFFKRYMDLSPSQYRMIINSGKKK